MRKEIFQKIKIPEGVEVDINGGLVSVKGVQGEISREFKSGKIKIEKKGDNILIGHKSSTKNEKKLTNTITAHINNMLKGIQEKFEYKLKICSSHFPMSVDVKDNVATVKNFLGEKISRHVKMPKNVEIKIQGDIITINSTNKEDAGQAAANFEKTTKIRNRDRRVFQDGIFIISKDGREM